MMIAVLAMPQVFKVSWILGVEAQFQRKTIAGKKGLFEKGECLKGSIEFKV
jgi:hypothetical protein